MTEQTVTMEAGDNPSGYTVGQVNAYLATADEDEVRRVLEAEQGGHQRVGILEGPHATPEDDAKDQPELQARTLEDEGKRVPEAEGEKYEKGYDGHSPARDAGEDLTLAAVTKGA